MAIKFNTVTVRGATIDASRVTSALKRINGTDGDITMIANVAALHLVVHNNPTVLTRLFDAPALRGVNGDLKKLGRDVFDYIKAHCPLILWDKEKKVIRVRKVGPDNQLRGKFAVPFSADKDGKAELVEPGDFALTFGEWQDKRAQQAPKGNPGPKSVKAETLTGQLTKALEALKAGRILGETPELAALSVIARELAIAATGAAHDKATPIDADKVAQAASVKPRKSKRADQKRATADA